MKSTRAAIDPTDPFDNELRRLCLEATTQGEAYEKAEKRACKQLKVTLFAVALTVAVSVILACFS